ncbi:DEAD/DEAH box helicase [Bdellovibrio sp. HCB-110]|uniref:DEAD/DEAH box helicase n=1 Tax=Bdellovibrio sp. HCB-110 TaxID=3391182 RepID=UPI0039B4B8BC
MAFKKIKSIQDLLEQYAGLIKNNRDKGTSFERLMKSYLELDPIYQDRFKKVYLWGDWPHRATGRDYGIDLVAEGFDGEYTAIQCKFFSPTYQIQKKDIDSFFTESGKTFVVNGKKVSFSQRIIISTSDNWSEPAEKSMHGQTIPVIRIHIRDLEQSPIDWSKFSLDKPEELSLKEKKKLRPHQEEAIQNVVSGFKQHERGKLIMACGTGKTFTALRLAEKITKKDGLVLFLVPSISLLSQTLREWTAEAIEPFHAFAVCSDSKVGKHSEDISKHDLSIPASTDTTSLLKGLERLKNDKKMTVIFSTYQSIDVVSRAQKKGLSEFDLIVCDEAHRTTGVTLADKEESHFVRVHDQKFLKGKKRIYMTATPRIFGNAVKSKAQQAGAELFSMDDETKFGPEFHRLGFGKAVSDQLLTDYKVLVLAVDESIIGGKFQKQFANEDGELELEDIARIIGCWNGLSKKFVGEEAEVEDDLPMRRAVAFASTIPYSKTIANTFQSVVDEYKKKNNTKGALHCELQHVDGTFNVLLRNQKLDWLKEEAPDNTCRILTNARCLSEGVDVPALDAVLFLNPRKSIVDVVQSVGRIMRRAEGKKYGYVILPIGIPAGVPPEEALKDNKKYEVVWQVLQALRAHDDRFDAEINKMELTKKKGGKVRVIGVGGGNGEDTPGTDAPVQLSFSDIEDWKDAIYAKIVLKCGSRPYWENWAADVAKIAEKHTDHIKKLLSSKEPKSNKAFEKFLKGIQKNINPSIGRDEAIEMLSQHMITKPVFDALFEHYPFTEKNPVSRSMQSVLKIFESNSFAEDSKKLKVFYDSVKMRVKGIDTAEGRQKIIVELYDRFFKVAFPKMSERLGIVYTPIEVVDFIINSVEAVLKDEFNQSLSDKNIHILDPFTGTGTFIVRLLQSGIIKPEDLKRKFKNEIHANEIVLLAYYIAAINIEETYHSIADGEYSSFDGAVLTDTFQLNEEDAQIEIEAALPENSERVNRQKKLPIQVIISNPPYSVGQKSGNDNNQNLEYVKLDERINATYAAKSSATLQRNLYDSYIRAIKWATDRIGDQGVIGFVTNGSYLDAKNMDGVRKSLAQEFSKIFCVDLRGDQRTTGLESKKEGGKIFGSGSRTPVAITFFIKNKNISKPCEIKYYRVGDFLSRDEKLKLLVQFKSIKSIDWKTITPNADGDWISQRNPEFQNFMPLGSKKDKNQNAIFSFYSLGVVTNRDAWVYSFSKKILSDSVIKLINSFNSEMKKYENVVKSIPRKKWPDVVQVVSSDSKEISWTRGLRNDVKRFQTHSFDNSKIVVASYRPFVKSYLYFDRTFNESVGLIPSIFPRTDYKNLVISVIGQVDRKGFSVLMTDKIPDLCLLDTGQYFPLFYYENEEQTQEVLSGDKADDNGYIKKDAISDFALQHFRESYSDLRITKKDIFYYIYGLLHSPEYKHLYINDLNKMLPRIPLVKNFWNYSTIGSKLSDLHVNYEKVETYGLNEEIAKNSPKDKKDLYKIEQIKFGRSSVGVDKSKIILNQFVTLTGIPIGTYDYVINGKSALESLIEQYKVSVDLDKNGNGSGIKNDPNEWSDDPRYIVDLVKRIVTVSLETSRLVSDLPKFELLDEKK